MVHFAVIAGTIMALRVSYFWLRLVWLYWFPRNQRQRLRAYGEWAVVTGCTDGIGREYALQLAEKGMSIVLISRSAEKLHNVAEEIATRYSGVNTKTVVADFTRLDVYQAIEQAIADIDVGVLVNNVGIGDFEYDHPKVGEKPRSALVDTVVCNCVSQTAMSNLLLPKLAAKGRGLIVNVSSGSALLPAPYLAVYGATKRFNLYLGEAMRVEYAEFGVDVQTVAPMYIATNLSGIRRTSFFVKNARSFVREHLNTLGVAPFVHGCVAHEIEAALVGIVSSLPTPIADFLTLRRMKKTARRSVAAKKRRAEAAQASAETKKKN